MKAIQLIPEAEGNKPRLITFIYLAVARALSANDAKIMLITL